MHAAALKSVDMGVLMDYFAATREELAGLDLDLGPAGNGWPHVDCKGWILEVQEFAKEIAGRDASEFGKDELVGGQNDPAYAGPWTVRVNQTLAETLAGLDAARIRANGERYMLEDWEVERL